MRYLSVCSGIEAATVAWKPLGWQAVGFAEIEKFPSAVLQHHYPEVRNYGDFTKIDGISADLLVGGTPCQDFSVAGLRAGMDGERGQLTIEFARLAERIRPRWLVWENVLGVLSIDGGRAFGTFLGLLGQLGYGFAYRVLDAQYFGVPQRRRRVFVVGYLGDWRRPFAVLSDLHSLSGHPPPRREAGKGSSHAIAESINASGRGFERTGDSRGQDCLIASTGDTSHCLNAGGMGRQDYETETLIACNVAGSLTVGANQTFGFSGDIVAHSLRGDGYDASEDGTGRGTPLVPIAIQEAATRENESSGPDGVGVRTDGIAYTLEARSEVQAICFSAKDHGADAMDDCSPTLRAGGHTGSHANAGVMPAVAFQSSQSGVRQVEAHATLDSNNGSRRHNGVIQGMAVRRLLPIECERLMGLPDNYTKISAKTADGPRYKSLGNSMAVPCMRWIGERIQMVEDMP